MNKEFIKEVENLVRKDERRDIIIALYATGQTEFNIEVIKKIILSKELTP